MQTELILTIMATDRPGIVELLADVVASYEGNWVESAMSRLGGEFAGILRITIADAKVAGLEKALKTLAEDGITILSRKGTITTAVKSQTAYVEVVGQDHQGIVRDLSKVFADNKVNVDKLRTKIFDGPMSGEHMFSAEADIVLPKGLELDELCEQLEDLAGDLMVDVKMCSIKDE